MTQQISPPVVASTPGGPAPTDPQDAPRPASRVSSASFWVSLWRGLRSQPALLLLSLGLTSTGVVMAIEAAGAGLIVGGIAGLMATPTVLTHAVSTGWTQGNATPLDAASGLALAVLTVIGGAGAGAVAGGGFVIGSLALEPASLLRLLLGGFLLLVLAFWVAWWTDLWVLRRRGGRALSWEEWARLTPLLDRLLQAHGLTRGPRLVMQDTVLPTAEVSLRGLIVTTGLLEALDDEALLGVLAHELAHWQLGDPAARRLLWLAALPLTLAESLLLGVSRRMSTQRTATAMLQNTVVWTLLWPIHVALRLVIAPPVARRQRRQEYRADAHAAEAGDAVREGLRRALRTLAAFDAPPTDWRAVLVRPHPPTPLRLDRLVSAEEAARRRAVQTAHAHRTGAVRDDQQS